jgi:hypothetical protein
MELQVPIWHSGMHEAFLIHVRSAQEVIKKKGYFKAFEENTKACAELLANFSVANLKLRELFKFSHLYLKSSNDLLLLC